jgi:hypothetical protein
LRRVGQQYRHCRKLLECLTALIPLEKYKCRAVCIRAAIAVCFGNCFALLIQLMLNFVLFDARANARVE